MISEATDLFFKVNSHEISKILGNMNRLRNYILVDGFKYFLFSPWKLGKIWTNIFQLRWNHQPVYFLVQKSTQHVFVHERYGPSLATTLISSDKNPRLPRLQSSQMEVSIKYRDFPSLKMEVVILVVTSCPFRGVGTQRPHLAGRVALGHLHIFRVSYWVSTPGVMKLCPTSGETRASKYGSR